MNHSVSNASADAPAPGIRYCGRCARRSSTLRFDDLSSQELCDDCRTSLARRRGALAARSRTKTP